MSPGKAFFSTHLPVPGFGAVPLRWLPVALLSCLALIIQWQLATANHFPTVDGTQYMDQARILTTEGRLPFSCFPPGWPLLISVPLLFLNQADPMVLLRTAQGANILLGLVLALTTFLFLRTRLGYWPALVGMAVIILLPENLILAKGDLSEISYASGLMTAWLFFERGRKETSGVFFGLTYLIRPEAIIAAVGLLIHDSLRNRKPSGRMTLGLAIPVLPYLAFIKIASGNWGLSSKDIALTQSLASHPGGDYLHLIIHNLGQLGPLLTGMLGIPLVLLSLWGFWRGRGSWLWLLAPLLPVPLIINPMVVRFWYPYVPVFLLGAGLALLDLKLLLPRGKFLAAGLLIVTLGGVGYASRDDMIFVRHETEAYYGLKDAGLWLQPMVEPETIIAAYKPYTSFWAGCRFLKFPVEPNTAALVAWAKNHHAEYFIVNVLVAHTTVKALDPLLQKPLPNPYAKELELVQLFQYDIVEQNTAVYRVIKSP